MKEWLTIFDENGNKQGKKLRDDVHQDGDWHETFHCWYHTSRHFCCANNPAIARAVYVWICSCTRGYYRYIPCADIACSINYAVIKEVEFVTTKN